MRRAFVTAVLAALLAFAGPCQASNEVPGVSADAILVGCAMPMTGSQAYMGIETAAAIETVFAECNAHGGVYGRKLVLVKRDSTMDPARAASVYRNLILDDKVFAVLFGFGSFIPESYPLFESEGVPWLFPWAPPAEAMKPPRRCLFGLFPTSSSQIRVETAWLLSQKRWSRLACLYGDSESGRSGLLTLKAAIASSSLKLVASEAIRNDATSARDQASRMARAKPDIVLILGMLPEPAALFVAEARRWSFKSDLMVQMSLTGGIISHLLKPSELEGLYGGWWGELGYPLGNETPRMKALRLALLRDHPGLYDDENISGSVEHGLSVELFIEALRRAGPRLTREGLVRALESLKAWDTGKGNFATFGPDRREGISGGYVLQYRDGTWVPRSRWMDLEP